MSKRLIKSVPELDIKSLLDKEKIAIEILQNVAKTLKVVHDLKSTTGTLKSDHEIFILIE